MMPGAGNFATGIAWNPGPIYDTKQRCHKNTSTKIDECFWYSIGSHQSSGSFDYDVKSQPFAVQVTPVGLVQMNILESILYQPPGNESTVSYSTTVTEGTSYSVGENSSSANSATSTQGTCSSLTWGLQVTASKYVGTSGSASTTNTNCNWSLATNGSSHNQVEIATASNSSQTGTRYSVPDVVDGNGKHIPIKTSLGKENYFNEPFWYDLFVVDLRQPFAVYSNNGNPVYRLLPLPGWPAPVEVPLAQLAGCASGMPATLPGTKQTWSSTDICTVGGGGDSGSSPISLDPGEALSLMYQDPFYPLGQGTNLKTTSGNRVNPLNFSCPNIETCPSVYGLIESTAISSATNVSGTQTILNNFQTSTNTSGFQLAGSGASETGTNGSNNVGTTTINYSTSTALTTASTFTYRVNLRGSNPDKNNPISIGFYQDNVFGTIMFYESQAAQPPSFFSPPPFYPLFYPLFNSNNRRTPNELGYLHKVFLKVMEANPPLRDKINNQLQSTQITQKCCRTVRPSSSKLIAPVIQKNLLKPWRDVHLPAPHRYPSRDNNGSIQSQTTRPSLPLPPTSPPQTTRLPP